MVDRGWRLVAIVWPCCLNVDALTDKEVGQGKVAQMLHGRPMALSILTILLIYMIR